MAGMRDVVRELQAIRLQFRGPRENSMHIAAVLRAAPMGKVNPALIMAVGINSQRQKQSLPFWGSLHAECDAVGKMPRHEGRRPLRVDLVVVRTNRSGGTSNSQPCRDCLVRLRWLSAAKNIAIHRLWFTDQAGNLSFVNHGDFVLLPPHVSYAFRHERLRTRH